MAVQWFPPSVAPTDETPVIAEYREWNERLGKKRTHTVWYFDGAWRCYPETGGYAYVDRWRHKKASAIEARSDATGTGAAEGESAVPKADAQGGAA